VKIKVCGMRDPVNIRDVGMLRPDFMGFIFYPGSKRYVGDTPGNVLENVPEGVNKVGVFVNEELSSIIRLAGRYGFTHVQLHGNETPDECRQLGLSGLIVIKAFSLSGEKDMEPVKSYENTCDYLLFDTPSTGWGGSGKQFDWSLLKDFKSSLPFFLSGGIGAEDLDALKKLDHPGLFAVDVNSRFETAAGIKDIAALDRFIKKLR